MAHWILRRKGWFIGLPSGSDGRESACNAGDRGSIPGSGKCPGEGNGHSLHCSCLENSTDRGTVHGASMGSRRVGYDWVTNTSLFHWILQATFVWSLNCINLQVIYRVRWTVLGRRGEGSLGLCAVNLGWRLCVHHCAQLCLHHIPVVHTQNWVVSLFLNTSQETNKRPPCDGKVGLTWEADSFSKKLMKAKGLPSWLRM